MLIATCEVLLLGLLVCGAILDVRTFRLPNWLTFSTALVAVPWLLMTVTSLQSGALHLLAGGLMLVVGLIAFRFQVLGGGDVKWMAALALWVGFSVDLMRFLMIMTTVGAVLALVVLVLAKIRPGYGMQDGKQQLPYGVAIAIAGIDFWIRRGELGQGLAAVAFG